MTSFSPGPYFCVCGHRRWSLCSSGDVDRSCAAVTVHEELSSKATLKGNCNLAGFMNEEIAEF